MSMNTINNIVKRFADKFIVYSGICYVIKHSKINCDSKHYGRRSASCLIFEESYFSQPKNILIIYVRTQTLYKFNMFGLIGLIHYSTF